MPISEIDAIVVHADIVERGVVLVVMVAALRGSYTPADEKVFANTNSLFMDILELCIELEAKLLALEPKILG